MKRINKRYGYFTLLLGAIIASLIIGRMVLYIPMDTSHCFADTKYANEYCVFIEINDRYTILNKEYFGRSGILKMLGLVDTKPIYLLDKKENRIIKKGKVGWWVNSDDLEIENDKLYFKNNYNSGVWGTYYNPSLKKPWLININ